MTTTQSIHRIFAIATLAATAFLSQAVHAQGYINASRVTVPFAFNLGTQHYEPGTYTVRMVDENFLMVSSRAETGFVMVRSDTKNSGPAGGYVTFRKYGDRYFLAEYHQADSDTAVTVPESRNERRAARDFAMNRMDPGRVRVALLETGDFAPRP